MLPTRPSISVSFSFNLASACKWGGNGRSSRVSRLRKIAIGAGDVQTCPRRCEKVKGKMFPNSISAAILQLIDFDPHQWHRRWSTWRHRCRARKLLGLFWIFHLASSAFFYLWVFMRSLMGEGETSAKHGKKTTLSDNSGSDPETNWGSVARNISK